MDIDVATWHEKGTLGRNDNRNPKIITSSNRLWRSQCSCIEVHTAWWLAEHPRESDAATSEFTAWGVGTVRCCPCGGPWSCGEFLGADQSWPPQGRLETAKTQGSGLESSKRFPEGFLETLHIVGSYSLYGSKSSSNPLNWMLGCFQNCFHIWRNMNSNK